MSVALAAGWTAALACAAAVVVLRRRMARIADSEHELRGALTAFGLAIERVSRARGGRGLEAVLDCDLRRARTALDDLAAARGGRRPAEPVERLPLQRLAVSAARAWDPPGGAIEVDWRAGDPPIVAPGGRVAQALGNIVSNAVEHGRGPVRLVATRDRGSVRMEVSNARRLYAASAPAGPGRGRGLRIAERAARAAGGRLAVTTRPDRVTAALELPVER